MRERVEDAMSAGAAGAGLLTADGKLAPVSACVVLARTAPLLGRMVNATRRLTLTVNGGSAARTLDVAPLESVVLTREE